MVEEMARQLSMATRRELKDAIRERCQAVTKTTADPFAPEALYELKIDTDGNAVADIALFSSFPQRARKSRTGWRSEMNPNLRTPWETVSTSRRTFNQPVPWVRMHLAPAGSP